VALYTDFNDPMNTAVDASAINNAIKNILLTKVGSMPGKPTFGSNVSDVIFNQIDHITVNILQTLIEEALYKWEPRILVNDVQIREVPEFNKLVATLNYDYRDKGLQINEQISIAFIQ